MKYTCGECNSEYNSYSGDGKIRSTCPICNHYPINKVTLNKSKKLRFIESMPTRYHPFTVKYIMTLDGQFCVAYQGILDYKKSFPGTIDRIKEQMFFHIKKQQQKSFEFLDYHVEIHFNFYYKKFFYTTGISPERFYGAGYYFETSIECEKQAKEDLLGLWNEEHKYDVM